MGRNKKSGVETDKTAHFVRIVSTVIRVVAVLGVKHTQTITARKLCAFVAFLNNVKLSLS